MAQLRQQYEAIRAQNAEVIVIGPEPALAFRNYWANEKLPFVGLPNPGGSVLRLYGQEVNLFKYGRMPAQLLVDREGIARFVHYGKDMTDIPSPEEILHLLDILNGKAVLAT